jgi:pyruvate dehydrogenase E1 component beta subunit
MAQLTLVQAVNEALRVALAQDERVVVLGEDVGENGGVFRATDGLLESFGKARVIDTPLSEGGILGAAIGMAAYGLRPVPEIQFTGFMPMAFDQIVSHAARLRWRTRGRHTCPLVVRAPYGAGIHAPEHHSESQEAYFAHTPGLKVVVPSSPHDAKGLLLAAIADPDPVLFFEPKRIYRAIRQEVPEGAYEVPLGPAAVVREGQDVTVVAFGSLLPLARQAADALESDGVSVEVLDLRTVWPLDLATVLASIEKTGRCVVVQEAPRSVGLGAEVASLIQEKAFFALRAPVRRVSGLDTAVPFYRMEHYYLPNASKIQAAVRDTLAY